VKKRFWVMSFAVAAAACVALSASAHGGRGNVLVEIVDQQGQVFREIPAKAGGDTVRSYLEAVRDARYRIRIRNYSGSRVGVVVAVDGRNIISGARSELGNDEPMYVLDHDDTQEYSGWRANLSEVNEFYFTEWKDSYAEAFGDRSARGVIAVAVYREKGWSKWFSQRPERGNSADSAASSAREPAPASSAGESAASARDQAERQEKKSERRSDAGTGYGDRRTEAVTQVEFSAESRASQRVFLKYEWRETLCSKRVLSCEDPPNRFWPSERYGFAPPPPGRAR
jgi:hypothetical protein